MTCDLRLSTCNHCSLLTAHLLPNPQRLHSVAKGTVGESQNPCCSGLISPYQRQGALDYLSFHLLQIGFQVEALAKVEGGTGAKPTVQKYPRVRSGRTGRWRMGIRKKKRLVWLAGGTKLIKVS